METGRPPANSSKTPRPWPRRIGRTLLLYVLVPYLSVIIIFAAFQRRLIYRPVVADDLSLAAIGSAAGSGIDVELRTDDGHRLRGWLLRSDHSDRTQVGEAPLVLYFPGNSLNRRDRLSDLREMTAAGFDVLIFDYRGFGDSTGSPSEANLSADATRIWNYATKELGYEQSRIVVFGESIGGAVALSLWSEKNENPPRPAAVLLNSTFASLPQTVAWHYPSFPFQYLLFDRWESSRRIGNIDVPITVFHGTDDEFVPIAHGRALAEAAPQARFVEIRGGTHNDIPIARLREELEATINVMSASNEGLE